MKNKANAEAKCNGRKRTSHGDLSWNLLTRRLWIQYSLSSSRSVTIVWEKQSEIRVLLSSSHNLRILVVLGVNQPSTGHESYGSTNLDVGTASRSLTFGRLMDDVRW